ncbi:colicin D domain-containing protein [Rugamonas sp.]|uniref:colicin D domain-containing protein n=1 Tax=Rugamonas sp. TaxID=1926287 RepID=UPI0025FF1B7C|nr:colicin D domain-containing protein [Rugamonas sp.]
MHDGEDRTTAFSSRQLRHAFKHAADFGIAGNVNSAKLLVFRVVLEAHINAGSTEMHIGTYRLAAVTHFIDRDTRLNVMRDAHGDFLSGWALSEAQLAHLLDTGRLGGGS